MPMPRHPSKFIFQILGICSPYIAVLLGVFFLKNGFLAVLFYHLVLLICIIKINKSSAMSILFKGFHRIFGPLICFGGLLPGVVIFSFWSIAKRDHAELSQMLTILNLNGGLFVFFAIYACIVNPFLEESFWRGCFGNETRWPNLIDGLFAGYHALAIFPAVKLPYIFLILLALIFVGWFFRMLYRRSGGLLIPSLSHIIADIAILYALWKVM